MSACGGKKRYATPVDAMLALDKLQKKRNVDETDKYERTFYECVCGCYHLTSWKTQEG